MVTSWLENLLFHHAMSCDSISSAARIIFSRRKSDHITLQLCDLHWLRVPQWIEFKLTVLVLLLPALYGSVVPHM